MQIVTSSFTAGTAAFDEDGTLEPIPEYRKFELSWLSEYGFTPWLTGILKAEVRAETSDGWLEKQVAAAAGGARVRILKRGNWMFSAQLLAETGDYDTIGFGVGGTGPGIDGRLLLGYGTAIAGVPVYADLQVGYRHRSDAADEGKLELTLGVKPLPRWEATVQSFNTMSLEEPPGIAEYRYHKVRGAVMRKFDGDWALELGGTVLFFGKNAIREYGIDMSLRRDF